jgi:restriction endonuclease S subunit
MTTKKINEVANLWEKTKDPKYKDLWYKLVKEFGDGKDISNTNSSLRRHSTERGVRVIKTDAST